MILYVVTETEEKYHASTDWLKTKWMLETCARDLCLILHYAQLSRKLIADLHPWAICHSGGGTPHEDYDVLTRPAYRWVTRRLDVPQIGFCGGHQILAVHYGGEIGDMRPVRPDEPDFHPDYHPGQFKEWGIYPVRVLKPDPLFNGLPKTIRVQERHRSEVTRLPECLELLASSTDCRVQAFVHRRKPIYGVQFHPESAAAPGHYSHGLRILRNFFRLARAAREVRP